MIQHSGARAAEIELFGTANSLCLCVSDSGVGFDPQSIHVKAGLGLVSMQERFEDSEERLYLNPSRCAALASPFEHPTGEDLQRKEAWC